MLEFQLDEVPLLNTGKATGFYIFGVADIAYSPRGNWVITDIWIEAHGERKLLPLDKSDVLWKPTHDAIVRECSDSIQSAVNEAMDMNGIRVRSGRQHHGTVLACFQAKWPAFKSGVA